MANFEVNLIYEGKTGKIRYNEEEKKVDVSGFSDDIAKNILKYMNTEQVFYIPESQDIDDFREDKVKPTENQTYAELALCHIWAALRVWVDWKSQVLHGNNGKSK